MKTGTSRIGLSLLIILLALMIYVVVDNWGSHWLGRGSSAPPASTLDKAAQIERGQYLARVGNCIACHSAKGAPPLAGGRRIDTPFGGVFSSNLTPDPETGLGRWTPDDFWQALHHGRSKGGRLLVPAFPYNHTSVISREDSDALLAWLQSLPAVHQSPTPHALMWPVGTQPALAVWRSLFFTPSPFVAEAGQSAEWNRGAYLVRGLGHCAACHSRRNALGASGPVDDLSGGLMPMVNWYAPDLTKDKETGLASTPLAEIVRLLQTGSAAQAQTSGPMAEVVQHGLQYMSPSDLQAVAVYLKSRAQAVQAPQAPARRAAVSPRVAEMGLKTYERHCAQCHGEQGQGVSIERGQMAYPPLAGNRAVQLKDPTNLVQMVLYGGYSPATAGHPQPFGMPPFVLELDDRDIAAVLTHLRTQWGNTGGEVTPLQVNRIRASQDP
jgi:mono/diheme cytochrome c family protein